MNLNGGEFEVSPPKGRIMSLAYDGKDKIAYTVSTKGSSSPYLIEGGKERELADVSPSLAVTDVGDDYVVGFEGFTGWMKASNLVIVSMSGEVKRVTPKEGIVDLGTKVCGV